MNWSYESAVEEVNPLILLLVPRDMSLYSLLVSRDQ